MPLVISGLSNTTCPRSCLSLFFRKPRARPAPNSPCTLINNTLHTTLYHPLSSYSDSTRALPPHLDPTRPHLDPRTTTAGKKPIFTMKMQLLVGAVALVALATQVAAGALEEQLKSCTKMDSDLDDKCQAKMSICYAQKYGTGLSRSLDAKFGLKATVNKNLARENRKVRFSRHRRHRRHRPRTPPRGPSTHTCEVEVGVEKEVERPHARALSPCVPHTHTHTRKFAPRRLDRS